MTSTFKEFIRWVDDTVTLVLSRRDGSEPDPEKEVAPLVDGLFAHCIGNRTEIDQDTILQICDSVVAWAYLELRDVLPLPNQKTYRNEQGKVFPGKVCVAEITIPDERRPEAVGLKMGNVGKEWPLDEDGNPISPDERTVIVDSSKYDRVVIVG